MLNTISNKHETYTHHHSQLIPQQLISQHNYKHYPIQLTYTEAQLLKTTRRTLAQLITNKSPILLSYLNKIDADKYPLPLYPHIENRQHTTSPSFNCTKIKTKLTVMYLWTYPVEVGRLLAEWMGSIVSQKS